MGAKQRPKPPKPTPPKAPPPASRSRRVREDIVLPDHPGRTAPLGSDDAFWYQCAVLRQAAENLFRLHEHRSVVWVYLCVYFGAAGWLETGQLGALLFLLKLISREAAEGLHWSKGPGDFGGKFKFFGCCLLCSAS